jgi:hypothetical protein
MTMRLFAFLCSLLVLPAVAAELDGVRLDDRVTAGTQELQLNGMAVRTRFFFKVYVAGLYLPQKTQSAQAVFDMPGTKRMTLVMLRDVDSDAFTKSLRAALHDSNSAADLERLKPQIDALFAAIQRIGEAKKGATIVLDFAPGAGTTLLVNGAVEAKQIPGDDFFTALLRIWLGEGPVAANMKKALLGGPQ